MSLATSKTLFMKNAIALEQISNEVSFCLVCNAKMCFCGVSVAQW